MKDEVTMKKDNTNVKETENKDEAPLLDGELENVAGGGYAGKCYGRWECYECGAHGRWFCDDETVEEEKGGHTQLTGHTGFRIFYKRIDPSFDPDVELPSFSDYWGPYNA